MPTIKLNKPDTHIGVLCMVCEESVRLSDNEELLLRNGHHINPKICDKCKKAILRMRKVMEDEDNNL